MLSIGAGALAWGGLPAPVARADDAVTGKIQVLDPPSKRIRGLLVDGAVSVELDGDQAQVGIKGSLRRKGAVILGGEDVLAKSDSDETPTPFEWKTSVPKDKLQVEFLVVDSTGKNLVNRYTIEVEKPAAEEKPPAPAEAKVPETVEVVPLDATQPVRWKRGKIKIFEEEGKRLARFKGKLTGAGQLADEKSTDQVLADGDGGGKKDFEWTVEVGELPVQRTLVLKSGPGIEPKLFHYCIVEEGKYAAATSCVEEKVVPTGYPVWRLALSAGGDSYQDSVVEATSQLAARLMATRWFGLLLCTACRARVEASVTALPLGGTPGPVRFLSARVRAEYEWAAGVWSGSLGGGEAIMTSFGADYGFSPLYFPEVAAELRRQVGTGSLASVSARFGPSPGGSQIAFGATYFWPAGESGDGRWGLGGGFESLNKANETGELSLTSWGLAFSRSWN